MKRNIPLAVVKVVCVAGVLLGLFAMAAGNWVVCLCMLLGSYLFERNLYRCPSCGKKLDMKAPLFRKSVCPACKSVLRQ